MMQTAVQMNNTRVQMAGGVRPFAESDLGAIAELYLKVFPQGRQYSQTRVQERFRKVLLQNPWYDPTIPSLVYEQDGKVIGFLGIVVRSMMLRNEPIRVAVSNHFMVDPDSRSTKAGLSLLSKLFSGPQDLAIAEAGDASRKIWEALGGRTSLSYSMYWTRLLRPARYGLYQLERKSFPRVLDWISRPFCGIADALAARMKSSPLYQAPHVVEEELTEKDWIECMARFTKPVALRPCYDESSLQWLVDVLAAKQSLGTLRKAVVRGDRNEIIGWYVYYLNEGGVSTVLQINASQAKFEQVMSHLCYHAWKHGSIALSGRLQPRFTKEYSANHCLLHWRSWMLVHSRDLRVLEAVDHQDAFFTPLEGESWISVEGELPDSPPPK
jgi:hypothetical protein